MSVRWTANQKATVIADVRSGTVAPELVLAAWDVSLEEYQEWQDSFDAHGIEALKVTKLQRFRAVPRRPRVRRSKLGEKIPPRTAS
jgi:hypothetical protein